MTNREDGEGAEAFYLMPVEPSEMMLFSAWRACRDETGETVTLEVVRAIYNGLLAGRPK